MKNIFAVYISLSKKKIWPSLHEQDWKSVPFYMNRIIIQCSSEDTLHMFLHFPKLYEGTWFSFSFSQVWMTWQQVMHWGNNPVIFTPF